MAENETGPHLQRLTASARIRSLTRRLKFQRCQRERARFPLSAFPKIEAALVAIKCAGPGSDVTGSESEIDPEAMQALFSSPELSSEWARLNALAPNLRPEELLELDCLVRSLRRDPWTLAMGARRSLGREDVLREIFALASRAEMQIARRAARIKGNAVFATARLPHRRPRARRAPRRARRTATRKSSAARAGPGDGPPPADEPCPRPALSTGRAP
jgi:hypothetical protein